jgi:glycosyltransferase involved in cell wall biosynthesis
MRVLFNVRPDYESNPGGDAIQIKKTADALRKRGINVEISSRLDDDLGCYDIVHLFNITAVRETYLQCRNARSQGKRIAVSPIYWNMEEYNTRGRASAWTRAFYRCIRSEGLRVRMRRLVYLIRCRECSGGDAVGVACGFERQQRYVLESADVILPNSEAERECIRRDFNTGGRQKVVMNAVDEKFYNASAEPFLRKYGRYGLSGRDFALCVSRLEDRKNTINTIRVLNHTGLRTVMIGQANPAQVGYYERCRRIAHKNILFINHIDHEELPSAYAAARIHVLASWYETPGLSSLEAALSGCNIVSTDRGSAREYFGEYAEYCDPSSIESIRRAVVKAFEKPKDEGLKEHIRKNYSWDRAGEDTLKAYRMLLN